MVADGSIIIDTSISDKGMEEGFQRIERNIDSCADSIHNAGQEIDKAFSGMNFSKAIANAEAQLKSLEEQFSAVSSEFSAAVADDDDKSAERLAAKRTALYDKIRLAREKLAAEVAAAAAKEAEAEKKATEQKIKAAEKEAEAKKKAMADQFEEAIEPAERFNSKLKRIATTAFVFNVIRKGLRSVVSYLGSALMANERFAYSVNRLKGSLQVAFQPIYEAILPSLIALIDWLNVAVQAVGRFFAIIAGKSYSDMQKNASSLNSSMNSAGDSADDAAGSVEDVGDAIEDTGKEAKKAEKYLAGFDEINRILKNDTDSLSDSIEKMEGLDSDKFNTDGFQGPVFEEVEIPKNWETAIEKLALRFKDIFFEWDDLNSEVITEKLLTALTSIAGGLIGFALGGPKGAILGMTIGAALGVVMSSIIFDGDGSLSGTEIVGTLITALGTISGGLIGFALGGPGGAALGATIGLGLSFLVVGTAFDSIKSKFEELSQKIKKWSREASEETESEFITPTTNRFTQFKNAVSEIFVIVKDLICETWRQAADGTENNYVLPTERWFANLRENIPRDFESICKRIVSYWDLTARQTESGYIIPTKEQFSDLGNWIQEKFASAKNNVLQIWRSVPNWFSENIVDPILGFFNKLTSGIADSFNKTAKSVGDAIERLADSFENIADRVSDGISGLLSSNRSKASTTRSTSSFSTISAYSVTPSVPYLAKGAVIPPNQKFLAVLGDQRSGTNVEAPLETIQQAVAMVMEDVIQGQAVGFEAIVVILQQILEAVLGIEIDGETISRAVNAYNQKMAIVKGG